MRWQRVRSVVVGTIAVGVTACGGGGGGGGDGDGEAYAPSIDPARFSSTVDNPLLPMAPGTRWVYEGRTDEGLERIVVEVTPDIRQVMGVPCVVVHDTASIDGKLVEDTFDWYAQDKDGNVWYFGEDTKEIKDGKVAGTQGSWEAGVDGAQPGIAMRSRPQVGDRYRQEYYKGEAEDMGEVLSISERVTVRTGSFENVVKTRDFTPLEPDLVEHKYYAAGVGLVLEETVKGGSGRLELVEVTRP
jgi:hypothetical protein